MIYIYSNKFFLYKNYNYWKFYLYVVIYYCSSNTTGSALTLLRISNNTIVGAVTLVVFLYFQMDIGNLYDRSTFKFH